MAGIALGCDTPECPVTYDGGNGLDKPGPYRPRGYLRVERHLMLSHAKSCGWLIMKEQGEHYCPACAIKIYNNRYKENVMTVVTTHVVPGSPMACLQIEASGEPGPGGAPNQYFVTGMDFSKNPLFAGASELAQAQMLEILFQHGNPVDGPNGITIEILLAICGNRLEGFQQGPYASEYNAVALEHISLAMRALQRRELSYLKPEIEIQTQAEAPDPKPERVVAIGGIDIASAFNDFPIREVPPEEATIEVRISTDARQSGADLLTTRILSMLIDKGYSTIGHVMYRNGDEENRSGFVADEDGLKELYGPENGQRLIDTLKKVKVVVIQDLDASTQKTRQ